MTNDASKMKPVAGDDSLGLELLEDGGFRINGMEVPNRQIPLIKMQGLQVERTTAPESVLTIKKEHATWRYTFRDRLWFELGPAKPAAVSATSPAIHPPSPSRDDGSQNGRDAGQTRLAAVAAVPDPEVLECQPQRVNKLFHEGQYLIHGLTAGQERELFARYAQHLKELAPNDAQCGRSRFKDEAERGDTCTLFRVTSASYTMFVVETRLVSKGGVCNVRMRAQYSVSVEGWVKTDDAFKGPKWWQTVRTTFLFLMGLGLFLDLLDYLLFRPFRLSRRLSELQNYKPACRRPAAITFHDELKRLGNSSHNDGTEYWGPCTRSNGALPWEPRFRLDDNDRSEIQRLFNLAQTALQKACADMSLKANDVKEGAA